MNARDDDGVIPIWMAHMKRPISEETIRASDIVDAYRPLCPKHPRNRGRLS